MNSEEHSATCEKAESAPELPGDFDVTQYAFLNLDLRHASSEYLKYHYVAHGRNEGRAYRDTYFDAEYFGRPFAAYLQDIRQRKNQYFDDLLPVRESPPLVVVDHDASTAGASLFAIMVARYVQGAVLLVPGASEVKGSLCFRQTYEYLHDPTLLYMLLERLDAKVVIFNSSNRAMLEVAPFFTNVVLHSHEAKEHYLPWTHRQQVPHFVVSPRIAESYLSATMQTCMPQVQPPFLDFLYREKLLSIQKRRIRNKDDFLCLAMCGDLNARKQPQLLAETALTAARENLPLCFLWVGGQAEDGRRWFGDAPVKHISRSTSPWEHILELADVFVLTSSCDPCPYVILEALFLGMPVITFKESMLTNHPPLGGQHVSMEGAPNARSILDAAQKITETMSKIDTSQGLSHVMDQFSDLRASYKKCVSVSTS